MMIIITLIFLIPLRTQSDTTVGIITKEFLENTSWNVINWKNTNQIAITTKLDCTTTIQGPYFGPLDTNVQKTYQNLQPHYQIVITLDILQTGKWKKENYYSIVVDGNEVYKRSDQKSNEFNQSPNYCKQNDENQNLLTALIQRTHSASTLTLEFQSSYEKDEVLGIKNLVIQCLQCHSSCLTCDGPQNNQCLTCPVGIASNGVCSCSLMVAFNHNCVSNCPLYYQAQENQCIIECSLFCSQCYKHKCQQCVSPYLLINNDCLMTCPSHASLINGSCVDYANQSDYGSSYVVKAFYNLENSLPEQIQQFIMTTTTINSKLTLQTYSIYQNTILLGGYGVWSDGQYQYTHTNLPIHNKLRIYLTTIVQNWNGGQFTLKIDDMIIYTTSSLSGTQQIVKSVSHNTNSLTLKIISTLNGSSFTSSIGVKNIFILADQCETGCLICGLTYCQQCQLPLKLLLNKCIACDSTTNRNLDCSCRFGYYESNLTSCIQCPSICGSCNNATECNTCNSELKLMNSPKCDKCETGYFMDGVCKQCSDKCSTCISQTTCITCNSLSKLRNPPDCKACDAGYDYDTIHNICDIQCPIGYFRNSERSCVICSAKCSECKITAENCTECATNRVSIPQCNCPDGGYDRMQYSNSWCTTCQLGVAIARFSDDLDSIIISLGGKLQLIPIPNCALLFKQVTLSKLGLNPRCLVESWYVQVYLGEQSEIQVGDIIEFNSQCLSLESCNQVFDKIQPTTVRYPLNFYAPQLYFNHEVAYITNEVDFNVQIIQQYINAQRQLQLIDWRLIDSSKNSNKTQIYSLIKSWNTQLKNQTFIIQQGILSSNQSFQISLYYVNILNQISNTSITINVTNFQIHIEYPSPPYFINKILTFQIHIHNGFNELINSNDYQVQLIIRDLNNEFRQLITENTTDYMSMLTIQPFTLIQSKLYRIQIILCNLTDIDIIVDQFVMYIQERDLLLQIQPQISQIGYKQEIQVNGHIFDQNAIVQNITAIKYFWSCLDIISKKACVNIRNQSIQLNESLNQIIPANSFEPYQIIQITLQANSQLTTLIIYIIENDIPTLYFDNFEEVSLVQFNYYDQILLKLQYQDNTNPDDLLYTAQLYQGQEMIGYFIFHYLHLNLQLQNHVNISQTNENIKVKVHIHNPLFIMSSTTSIDLSINIPPTNCTISMTDEQIIGFTTLVNIQISGCMDRNKPLSYQFVLYLDEVSKNEDYSQGVIINGLVLQEFSHLSQLSCRLTGNEDSILMVSIKDQIDGITNITYPLNISRIVLNSSQQINFIDQNTNPQELLRNINLLLLDANQTPKEENRIQQEIAKYIEQKLLYLLNCCYNWLSNSIDIGFQQLNLLNVYSNPQLAVQLNYLDNGIHSLMSNYSMPLNQFQLLQLKYKWFIYGNSLSILLSEIQDYDDIVVNDEDIQHIIDLINTLCEIILQTKVVNDNVQIIKTKLINIQVARCTIKQLQLQVGPILDDTHYLNNDDDRNLLDINEEKGVFDYRFTIFRSNPYFKQQAFQEINQLTQNTGLYYPNISYLNRQDVISITQPIKFTFETNDTYTNGLTKCASKQGDTWTTNSCRNQLIGNSTTMCSCDDLSPVTLIQTFDKFQSQLENIFSIRTFELIGEYSYLDVLFTYIILIFTIAYIWMLFYGRILDKRQYDTQPSPAKVFPFDQISEKATPDYLVEHRNSLAISDFSTLKSKQGELQHEQNLDSNVQPNQFTSLRGNEIDMQADRSLPMKRHNMRKRTDNTMVMIKVKDGQNIPETQFDKCSQSQPQTQRTILSIRDIKRPMQLQLEHIRVNKNGNLKQHECGIYKQIQNETITQFQACVQFVKVIYTFIQNFHQISSLYYRFNEQSNRIHRSTLLYVSILGQISILCVFGRIIDFNTVLALSIMQFVFGTTYKLLISFLIHSNNKILNYIGANIILISTLLFIFVILGSIAQYESKWVANLWALSYLGSFVLDYVIYRNINLIIVFLILIRYAESLYVKKIFLLFLEIGTSDFIYGVDKEQLQQEGKIL